MLTYKKDGIAQEQHKRFTTSHPGFDSSDTWSNIEFKNNI